LLVTAVIYRPVADPLTEYISDGLDLKGETSYKFNIGRTSVYYDPKESELTLDLMRRIDEFYTEDPTSGARRLCAIEALKSVDIRYGG